ncbi:MAG: MarR family transcriptional regulator [Desulfomonile tiedjei]|uniref:MarR family transcriptional regulator n=1 Tax=Desulfomonile tiedjei TaxID=2358 RepID=A0A9D6UZQ8_9BACT|nr:MarR family transcriptional regulator [Desulfomonile tiedjei]
MKPLRQGGFLIARIHQAAGRIFARKLKKYKLGQINPAQGRILFALWEEDGIPIQELADKTSLGKSTLTSMLDRLEAAGHLKRVPSKEDRRKVIIRLTGKDKKMQALYHAVSAEMIDLFYRDFTAGEIDMFEEALNRALGNLKSAER